LELAFTRRRVSGATATLARRFGLVHYIHILDDIIEDMDRSSALLPLFRSEQQLRLLAVLFADATEPLSIGELAQRAGVAQSTASREIARLAEHGLVQTHTVGRNTFVSANWSVPWAPELRSMLTQTVGVIGRLAAALDAIEGVEAAFIYGSWAARYEGEPGPPSRDIDVLVVGTASLRSVRAVLRDLEGPLRVDVNPVVVEPARWHAKKPEPFVAQLRSRPLIEIPLRQT
jgi:DNA-binding transcriptional ArsR family regulator